MRKGIFAMIGLALVFTAAFCLFAQQPAGDEVAGPGEAPVAAAGDASAAANGDEPLKKARVLVLIIEPGDSKNELVQKVATALEGAAIVKKETAKENPQAITLTLVVPSTESSGTVVKLIRGLGDVGLERVRFQAAAAGAKKTLAILSAPNDRSAAGLSRAISHLVGRGADVGIDTPSRPFQKGNSPVFVGHAGGSGRSSVPLIEILLEEDGYGDIGTGDTDDAPAGFGRQPVGVDRLGAGEFGGAGEDDGLGLGEDFGGMGDDFAAGPAAPRKYVDSGGVMITWSAKKDTAWGYSKKTGRWTKQTFDGPSSGVPIVGDSVAAWRNEFTIYAYSGDVGRWDVLRLKPAGKAPPVAVSSDGIIVQWDENVYTFAASTGRWTSPTDPKFATAAVSSDIQLKLFLLRHISAASASKLLQTLYSELTIAVVADQTIAVRANADDLGEVEAFLLRIDVPAKNVDGMDGGMGMEAFSHPEGGPAGASMFAETPARIDQRMEGTDGSSGMSTMSGTSGVPSSDRELAARITALRASYGQANRLSLSLAAAYREKTSDVAGFDDPDSRKIAEAMKQKFREAVKRAFDLRQQLQRAEMMQIQSRLDSTREAITVRQRIRDEIINRRVEDLLNPSLNWDGS